MLNVRLLRESLLQIREENAANHSMLGALEEFENHLNKVACSVEAGETLLGLQDRLSDIQAGRYGTPGSSLAEILTICTKDSSPSITGDSSTISSPALHTGSKGNGC